MMKVLCGSISLDPSQREDINLLLVQCNHTFYDTLLPLSSDFHYRVHCFFATVLCSSNFCALTWHNINMPMFFTSFISTYKLTCAILHHHKKVKYHTKKYFENDHSHTTIITVHQFNLIILNNLLLHVIYELNFVIGVHV